MAIEVPWKNLSPEALQGLIESYIHREGTDYGEYEQSLEQKSERLLALIKAGNVVIAFDEDSESCNLMSKQEWSELQNKSAEDEYFGY